MELHLREAFLFEAHPPSFSFSDYFSAGNQPATQLDHPVSFVQAVAFLASLPQQLHTTTIKVNKPVLTTDHAPEAFCIPVVSRYFLTGIVFRSSSVGSSFTGAALSPSSFFLASPASFDFSAVV